MLNRFLYQLFVFFSEQLFTAQTELKKLTDEYSDTVPRRVFDTLEARHGDVTKALEATQSELRALMDSFSKMLGMFYR